jgi:hypothetical protein
MMNAIERAILVPTAKIVVHRAARGQIFRQRRPLATGTQDEHQPVDHLPLIHRTLVAATLGGRDQRADDRPLVIR